MGIYLNQDNTMMYNSKTYSKIYIDKSMLIDFTNGNLFGENKAVCISRPRRFGKSMAANMLVAYYSRGCDSKELFSDLKIAKTDDFTKHINKYNVIHLTMTDYSKLSVDEMVQKITRILRKDLLSENPDMEFTDDDLGSNTLVIEDGKAHISDADCGDHTCIHTGRISREGEQIVCLPHKLVIEIASGVAPEIDASTH